MRNAGIVLLICAVLLSGCGGVTAGGPISTPTESTSTAEVSGMPLELEIISPQNINQLVQIAKWGDGKIYDVAISPDKQTIAVSMLNGVHLYSSTTLEEKQFIQRETETADTRGLSLLVSFSPDGKYLAISSYQGVSLFNLSTNEYDRSLLSAILTTRLLDIEISHDNRHVILYTDSYPEGNYALYDISEENAQLIYDRYFTHDHSGSVARFTADNKAYFFYWYLTNPRPYAMDVVDLSTHTVIERVLYEKINFDPMRTFYDISPDGKTIASLEFMDNETITRLIDTATGKVTQTLAGSISFKSTPQGGEVAWRDKWQISSPLKNETCKIVTELADSFQEVISEGNISTFVIFNSSDLQALELWDTAQCKKIKEVTFVSAEGVVFSPDGRLLATKSGYDLDVWDVKTGQVRFSATVTQFRSNVDTFAFSKDGKRLFTARHGDKSAIPRQEEYLIAVWDAQTGERLNTIKSDTGFLAGIVTGNNPEIVAILNSSNVDFWNVNSGKLLTTIPSRIFEFTHSGDAVWFAQGAKEAAKRITLLDVFTGEKIREFQTPYPYIWDISLSKDDARLGILGRGKDDGIIVVLDTETGAEVYKPQADGFFSELISGSTFFVISRGDYIDLWDFQTGSHFQRIYGHHKMQIGMLGDAQQSNFGPNGIDHIAFSPGDDLIISSGWKNDLRFWDVRTGNLIGEMEPDFYPSGFFLPPFAISPDGRLIVLTGTDGCVRLWGVPRQGTKHEK